MNAPTVLRLSGPEDTLRNIPGLLGYMPEDSLVVLVQRTTDEGVRLAVTLRFPLAETIASPEALLEHTMKALAASHSDTLTAVVWSKHRLTGDEEVQIGMPLAYLESMGVKVRDYLWTDGESVYGSFLCNDPECCPKNIDLSDVTGSEVVIITGQTVADSREDIEDALRWSEPIGVHTDVKADPVALYSELLAIGAGDIEIDAPFVALFAATTTDKWARDTFLRLFCLGRVNHELLFDRETVYYLAKRIPDSDYPTVLATLACMAYVTNAPIEAQFLCARAGQTRLAVLIDAACKEGMPPDMFCWTFADTPQSTIDQAHGR